MSNQLNIRSKLLLKRINMRLSNKEIKSIENAFTATFGSGEIYLSGSRTNDEIRGGDIDLFIVPEAGNNLAEKKLIFLLN
jgi:predicted nucleotidyltransferase